MSLFSWHRQGTSIVRRSVVPRYKSGFSQDSAGRTRSCEEPGLLTGRNKKPGRSRAGETQLTGGVSQLGEGDVCSRQASPSMAMPVNCYLSFRVFHYWKKAERSANYREKNTTFRIVLLVIKGQSFCISLLLACSLVVDESSIPEAYYMFYAGTGRFAIVLTYSLEMRCTPVSSR